MTIDTRRRIIGLGLAVALLITPVGPRAVAASPVSWPPVVSQTSLALPVASGIEYHHTTVATVEGPLEIHHLVVDLHNPTVQLGIGIAHDRLMSDDEPVSSMVMRSGAIAGVNADYFDIHESGMPLNIVIKNGQLLRSPWRWVALVLGRDGVARIIRYRWMGTIVLPETGESRALDGYNSGTSPNGVVAMSEVRGYGAPAPEPGVRQTVVQLTPGSDPSRYFVKQIWQQMAFYTPFPYNQDVILVGRGTASDWLTQKMTAGLPVQLNLTTDPDWHDAQIAIGGGPVLMQNGQIVEDPDAPAPKERDHRNPVIAVGLGRDGQTLTFVEVDGRQPALSIGLTRPQLAQYMQRLGAYQAMAFDSGGSATMVARLPGQAVPATALISGRTGTVGIRLPGRPAVVNSPSDGRERPVANAVLIYSNATPGPPARLIVNGGQTLQLLAGARVPLSVIAVDGAGNPVPLSDSVEVSAPTGLLTMAADGTVAAGTTGGSGTVAMHSGPATGTVDVSVVTRLARLVITPPVVTVSPGHGTRFVLQGEDAAGRPVAVPAGATLWTVSPPWLGAISPSGEFVPRGGSGSGTVTARLGGTVGRAHLTVGNTTRRVTETVGGRGGPPRPVDISIEEAPEIPGLPASSVARRVTEFDRGGWSFRGFPDTVTGAVTLVSTPTHYGHPSAKLEFHLDGNKTRAAYLVTRLPLAGEPTGIALWVYGDGSGVWLRGTYEEATGTLGTVTLSPRVDWQGWRPVVVMLPPKVAYPITWISFYVVEAHTGQAPSGTLYLSDLHAVYPSPK
jgi:hypothetical protein